MSRLIFDRPSDSLSDAPRSRSGSPDFMRHPLPLPRRLAGVWRSFEGLRHYWARDPVAFAARLRGRTREDGGGRSELELVGRSAGANSSRRDVLTRHMTGPRVTHGRDPVGVALGRDRNGRTGPTNRVLVHVGALRVGPRGDAGTPLSTSDLQLAGRAAPESNRPSVGLPHRTGFEVLWSVSP